MKVLLIVLYAIHLVNLVSIEEWNLDSHLMKKLGEDLTYTYIGKPMNDPSVLFKIKDDKRIEVFYNETTYDISREELKEIERPSYLEIYDNNIVSCFSDRIFLVNLEHKGTRNTISTSNSNYKCTSYNPELSIIAFIKDGNLQVFYLNIIDDPEGKNFELYNAAINLDENSTTLEAEFQKDNDTSISGINPDQDQNYRVIGLIENHILIYNNKKITLYSYQISEEKLSLNKIHTLKEEDFIFYENILFQYYEDKSKIQILSYQFSQSSISYFYEILDLKTKQTTNRKEKFPIEGYEFRNIRSFILNFIPTRGGDKYSNYISFEYYENFENGEVFGVFEPILNIIIFSSTYGLNFGSSWFNIAKNSDEDPNEYIAYINGKNGLFEICPFNLKDGKCSISCDGLFQMIDSGVGNQCTENCQKNAHYTKYEFNNENKINYCLDDCPFGYDISEENLFKCVPCGDNKKFYYNNRCIEKCPSFTHSVNGICSPCENFQYLHKGECVEHCPYGYYENIDKYICETCVEVDPEKPYYINEETCYGQENCTTITDSGFCDICGPDQFRKEIDQCANKYPTSEHIPTQSFSI